MGMGDPTDLTPGILVVPRGAREVVHKLPRPDFGYALVGLTAHSLETWCLTRLPAILCACRRFLIEVDE